jgi:cytochrome c
VNKAHGGNRAFVGRNLLHIKDPDGKEPNALIVKMGFEQGQGWVDFKWPNPVTKEIESKSAYVIRTNEVVCGVGSTTRNRRPNEPGTQSVFAASI